MINFVVDPGEHPCVWHYREKEYSGTVNFQPGGQTRGQIFRAPLEEDGAVSGQTVYRPSLPEDVALLWGRLRSGEHFVLLGAHIESIMQAANVRAKLALCGDGLVEPSDGLEFSEIAFQVGGLAELSGAIPIVETSPVKGPDKTFTVQWRTEADQESSLGGDTVALRYRARYRIAERYRFSISTSPIVSVSGTPRSVTDWITDFVEPVRNLASVVTQEGQDACWLTAKRRTVEPSADGSPSEREEWVRVFSPQLSQKDYDAERKSWQTHLLFDLESTGRPLAALIDEWRRISKNHIVYVELLGSVLQGSMSRRAALLALAPALESYHGQKYGNGRRPIEEHQGRRDSILRSLRDLEVSARDRSWLRRWIDPRGGYTLAERLRQLFEHLQEEDQAALNDKLNPLPSALVGVCKNPRDAWDIVAKIRNDLAHGGPPHSQARIQVAARMCQIVATFILLEELDVPTSPLRGAMRWDNWESF